jgi:hypothetical protein
MTVPSPEDTIKFQIKAEKAEVEAIKDRLLQLRTSFQQDAGQLRKQLANQHETLGKIIRYAVKLEEQLSSLKENVDYMKNLHKRNIH